VTIRHDKRAHIERLLDGISIIGTQKSLKTSSDIQSEKKEPQPELIVQM
jgi:hypothetical protein